MHRATSVGILSVNGEEDVKSLTPPISSTHRSVRQGPISEDEESTHPEEEENSHVSR